MNTTNDQQGTHNNSYGDSNMPGAFPKDHKNQEEAISSTTTALTASTASTAAPTASTAAPTANTTAPTATTATPYSPPNVATSCFRQDDPVHTNKDQLLQSPPKDPMEIAGTYRPDHQSPTSSSFTTTDASGYPDRQDGLSAYYSPPAVGTVQDLNDHHKHHQVPGSISADPHMHAHGQQENQHLHNSNNSGSDLSAAPVPIVDRPAVEVAELMGDTRLPEQTVVAHFLR